MTYCVEVLHNMSPWDCILPHSSVGDPTMILHEASLTFTNTLWSPPPRGFWKNFLFNLPKCLRVLFKLGLSGELTVPIIVAILY